MQFVGKTCHLCSEKLNVTLGAQGCPRCDIAWHEDCHSGSRLCPTCGGDPDAVNMLNEATRNAAVASAINGGRIIYWVMLGNYTAYASLSVSMIMLAKQDYQPAFMALVRSAIYFGTWYAAYVGSAVARKVLGVFAVLGLIAAAFVVTKITWYAAILVGNSIFTIWAVWFSAQVRAFEQSRNPVVS
ncbi:MAG: hypothetical protein ACAI34_25530 [Verrucomicrobium sp.]